MPPHLLAWRAQGGDSPNPDMTSTLLGLVLRNQGHPMTLFELGVWKSPGRLRNQKKLTAYEFQSPSPFPYGAMIHSPKRVEGVVSACSEHLREQQAVGLHSPGCHSVIFKAHTFTGRC